MQRVLMTEPIAAQGVQELRSYPAIEVVERHHLAADELRRAVASCAGLLVRSQTEVSRAVIEAGTELRVIGRAGAGVDNIDVAAATERGVLVMNTPGANAQAAAELTVGLLFAVARHIAAADASVKAGRWERTRFRGTQLLGKTLGIVGIGNVGRWWPAPPPPWACTWSRTIPTSPPTWRSSTAYLWLRSTPCSRTPTSSPCTRR